MIQEKVSKVKLLILDVDGVMTDGQIIINDHGEETKFFNVKDGQGLRLLLESGIDVAIITGRRSNTVDHRAKELGIREVYQGVKDKGTMCQKLIKQKGLTKDQICCMGDDLPDLPVFAQVGISIAVADAAREVRDAAGYITINGGGKMAVREVCELILKAQNKWSGILSAFSGGRK